jgi:hypothetical protein
MAYFEVDADFVMDVPKLYNVVLPLQSLASLEKTPLPKNQILPFAPIERRLSCFHLEPWASSTGAEHSTSPFTT